MLACLVLAACGREPLYEEQAYVFGTQVELKIYGENEVRARQLAGHVMREFGRLHHMLHAWKPGPLGNINAILAKSPSKGPIDPEMAGILRDATRLSELSGDLFNPAIGKLVAVWGFHADEFKPVRPDPKEIAKLVAARPRMIDIVIEGNMFRGKNPAVQVDLGGYAKGYALDVAADYLRGQGVRNALINIGGNIMAVGQHGSRPWRVGIQHPRKPSAIAVMDLHDGEAIGTSGDYQRYFLLDGRRYCHLIDPRTGYPVQGVEAATVVITPRARAGALSDAASKPVFIQGVKGWREAARAMGVELAMLIDGQGEVYVTEALRRRVEFLEKDLVLHVVK